MKRPLLLFTSAILVSIVIHYGTKEAAAQATFRVSSEEVVVHVLFLDRVGKAITDIRPDEVRIYEDETEQKLKRFFTSKEPFDVALLLDTSVSTRGKIDQIIEQSALFLEQLPVENRLLLISFDNEVYVDCDWTRDHDKAAEILLELSTNEESNSTVLYEAVTLTVQQKFERERPRKAMIVYTDGVDEGSRGISRKDSWEAIEESEIVAYAIQYDSRDHYRRLSNPLPPSGSGPDLEPPVGTTGRKIGGIFIGRNPSNRDRAEYTAQMIYESAKKYLTELADRGGGRYFEAPTMQHLSQAYSKIIDELSHIYTLTYIPSRKEKDGKFHRIKVAVDRPGVVVRTARRGGYWAR